MDERHDHMTTEARLMTAEELLNMPDDGRRYELIEGELIDLGLPPGFLHGSVSFNIGRALDGFVHPRGLGRVLAAETGFRISANPDTVRAPDAAFVATERLPEGDLPEGYLPFAPDLLAEVVSPSDRASDVQEKVHMWLDAGARLVWVAYPSTRSVEAYRSRTDVTIVEGDQLLDGAPVLEGFSIPASRLFE